MVRRLPLNISFLPQFACGNNARVELGDDWRLVRLRVLSDNAWCCTHCGKETADLEAHEVWEFRKLSETTVEQKLVDIRAVCNRCHLCYHVGFADKIDLLPKILEHYAKVRGLPDDRKEEITANAIDDAILIAARWNAVPWTKVELNVDYAYDILERKATPILPPPEREFARKITLPPSTKYGKGTWHAKR